MKQLTTTLLFSFLLASAFAQTKDAPLDKSPMDMCFYPVNYPVLKIQNKTSEPLSARIIYSRPQKNGRAVYGELVEYGKVWRLGANEATELDLYKDAKLGSKTLKKGRYTLYAIPYQDKWTIIFNTETDTWGAFQYDQKKDVLRVDAKTEKLPASSDAFTMFFEKSGSQTNLVMAWDDVRAVLPISF